MFFSSSHPEAAVEIIRNQAYRVVLEIAEVVVASEDSDLPFTSITA